MLASRANTTEFFANMILRNVASHISECSSICCKTDCLTTLPQFEGKFAIIPRNLCCYQIPGGSDFDML